MGRAGLGGWAALAGARRGGGNGWGEPAVLDEDGQGGHARPVALVPQSTQGKPMQGK